METNFGGFSAAKTFSSKMNEDEEESVGAGISHNHNFERGGGTDAPPF
jgi:replicative DNA helicase